MSTKDFYVRKNDLIKDSKLSLYLDKNLDFHFELKNLSRYQILFFLYVILDNLKEEKLIDKKLLLEMINELL